MKEIDATNQQCPAPVLLTRQVIEEEGPEKIRVVVDNDASRQNVGRYLRSMAYDVRDQQAGDVFHVIGVRGQGGAVADETPEPHLQKDPQKDPDARKIMVMISTDRIGYGDDSLGLKLMANFVRTLNEFGPDLWRVVFVNNGVKLTIESSGVVDALKGLEKDGVTIMVCGTCLEHYAISNLKQVGETTNMLDIVTAMHLADKVISM